MEFKVTSILKRAEKLVQQNAVSFTQGAQWYHCTVTDNDIEYNCRIRIGDTEDWVPCDCKFGIFNGKKRPCSHVMACRLLLSSENRTNS